MVRLLHMGLRRKTFIYVGTGLAALVGLLTLLALQVVNQSIDKLHQQRVAIVENVALGIDEVVLHIRAEMVLSASILGQGWRDETSGPDQDQLALQRNRLQSHLASFHRMDVTVFIALLDEQGRILQAGPSLDGRLEQSLAGVSIINASLEDGQVHVEAEEGILTGSRPSLSVSVPIRDDLGSFRGLLVADIPAFPSAIGFGSLLQGWATSYNLELLTDGGLLLASSAPGISTADSSHWSSIRALWQEQQSGITEHAGDDGAEAHIVAFAHLAQLPWGVTLEQPEEEVLELPWVMGRRFLVAIGAVVLVAVVLVWGFTRQIINPLGRLAATAQRFGSGDLETGIPPMGQDEIGTLAQSFETMRRQLKQSVDETRQWNQELELRVRQRTNELEKTHQQLSERDRERSDLLGRIITAQEEERRRIARELHDEVSQTLTGLVMSLGGAEALLARDPRAASERLESLRSLTSEAVEEVRRLIQDLRPSLLDDLGLTAAIAWYAENHLSAIGVKAELETEGLDRRFQPTMEIALFRVVQEAITNIVKHAQAKTVRIRLQLAGSAIVGSIEDDGVGFDVDGLRRERGRGMAVGLLGMEERIGLLDGELKIESQPGTGTKVHFTIPWQESDGEEDPRSGS